MFSYANPPANGLQVTDTPTDTETLTETVTPSETPTASETPTSTDTPTESYTPSETSTPSITNTPSSTPTPSSTSSSTATSTPTATATPAPLDEWGFSEGSGTQAADSYGYNNVGTITGATWTSYGVNGNALSFDGSGDYVNVANHAEVAPAGSFTLSVWVYPTSVGGAVRTVIAKGSSPDYRLALNADGYLEFRAYDISPKYVTGPILPVNTWSYVTAVYDEESDQIRLYVNAQQVSAQSFTSEIAYDTGAFRIGSNTSGTEVWQGRIDQVAIYGWAQTQLQIQSFYGGVATPTPTVSNTPTISPTPWPTPNDFEEKWGTGADGDVTISGTHVMDTTIRSGETCADSKAWRVTALTGTQATLSSAPSSACLIPGDEILLINLASTNSYDDNVGNYEFLRISAINGSVVTFYTQKNNFYGNNTTDDSNVGTNQYVFIQRVPNYNNLTITGTLKTSAFSPSTSKTGVIVFRVKGVLSGTGSITASALGEWGGGAEHQGRGIRFISSSSFYANVNGGGAGTGNDTYPGGGGGYGTAGQAGYDWYAYGGSTVGSADLHQVFLGGGGGGGAGAGDDVGGAGGKGGGIIIITAYTVSYTGSMTSSGQAGQSGSGTWWGKGGGGAGGTIYLAGYSINTGSLTATGGGGYGGMGAGGKGRIAIYYQGATPTYGSSNPSPYIATIYVTPTPTYTTTPSETPTITPTPTLGTPGPEDQWGTGNDGDVTITGTVNINSINSIYSRTCTDGGDAVAYSVIALTDSSATVNQSISSGCLAAGDQVLLINLQGTSSRASNVGNYEILQVASAVNNTVVFTSPKQHFYGDNSTDDTNLGTTASDQRVMLMRIPQYNNLTVNGTLTASAWNGTRFGVVAFMVRGTLSGTGVINVNALGYSGGPRGQNNTGYEMYGSQGESYSKLGVASNSANLGGGGADQVSQGEGAGGGYGTSGTSGGNAYGGSPYSSASLPKLFLGSGGGGSGSAYNYPDSYGTVGGKGAGALLIFLNIGTFQGSVSANGANGSYVGNAASGGGSGGSIRIEGNQLSFSTLVASGGIGPDIPGGGGNGGDGGRGRIAVYYQSSFSCTTCSNPAPASYGAGTPTPTYTPTATSTLGAPQTGWVASDYSYTASQPHAVTSVQRGETADTYTYDANGNMTQRSELGVTWTQEFNAENRLSSISNGTDTWTFVYDGDGNRVRQLNPDGTITIFLGGGLYTVEDAAGSQQVTKYYAIAGQRIALDDGTLKYLLTDHLGSVVAVTDGNGQLVPDSEQRYLPFGEVRLAGITETDFGFTGQRNLEATGLMDYNARWYDAALGRFVSADTVVTALVQGLDRYAYVSNNPLRYTDPSGNKACDDIDGYGRCITYYIPKPAKTITQQLITEINSFGWDVSGTATDDDLQTIRNGVRVVANQLARQLRPTRFEVMEGEQAPTAREVSWQLFGGAVVTVLENVGATCERSYDHLGFNCQASALRLGGPELVAHEIGHVFNVLVGPVKNNPYNAIEKLSGNWTQTEFDRSLGFRRHSGDYSANEKFADTWANWIYGTFSTNPQWHGAELQEFMDSQILYWLSVVGGY